MAYTTIDNPELYFQTKLYTGNASTQSITLDGSENMQPDWVWIKNRNATVDHAIFDSVRGVQKQIKSNTNEEELTRTDALSSFDSDGFSIGARTSLNGSGNGIVAWCWKESADAGFDIVSFTGNGSARTISHSLSAVPHWMVVKNRDEAENWCIYHTSIANTKALILNTTTAELTDSKFWNDTSATSSVFTVGNGTEVNGSSDNMIAYLWTAKQGFSKFGSYTGNGNADGAYVHLGFRPAWIVVKRTDSANSWMMYDNKKNPINLVNNPLYAEGSDAEGTSSAASFDFLSNGFKCRGTGSAINASGATMIYMAFAESPFTNSKGVPNNAR